MLTKLLFRQNFRRYTELEAQEYLKRKQFTYVGFVIFISFVGVELRKCLCNVKNSILFGGEMCR